MHREYLLLLEMPQRHLLCITFSVDGFRLLLVGQLVVFGRQSVKDARGIVIFAPLSFS